MIVSTTENDAHDGDTGILKPTNQVCRTPHYTHAQVSKRARERVCVCVCVCVRKTHVPTYKICRWSGFTTGFSVLKVLLFFMVCFVEVGGKRWWKLRMKKKNKTKT